MYWKTWINQWHRAQLTFHLNKSHETAFDQKISVVCVCACEDNGDATQRETINKAQKLKRIDWLADWLTTNAIVNNLSALTHIFNQAFGLFYGSLRICSERNVAKCWNGATSLHPLILWVDALFSLVFFFHSVSTFFMSSFLSVSLFFSLDFYREIFFVDLKRKAWQWYYKNSPRTMRCTGFEMKSGYSDKCHWWFQKKRMKTVSDCDGNDGSWDAVTVRDVLVKMVNQER